MFTGIIKNQGIVKKKSADVLAINADAELIKQLSLGASISVNGVCLTVIALPSESSFEAEVMPETFKKTMLGKLAPGNIVNLELPLKANGRFDGHIVQGHADGTAIVKSINQQGNSRMINFTGPKKLLNLMVEKGSVAVNGISLTLVDVGAKNFSVGIIPHTWDYTMLKNLKVKDEVNIELDILAKYIKKYMGKV